MRKRVEVNGEERPPVVDRVVRALAGQYLRTLVFRLRAGALEAFDQASRRAVTWLVAAALFITAAVLLVKAGLLGLVAMHVPAVAAYFGLGLLTLLVGWILLAWTSPRRCNRAKIGED